ncbi:MAG: hypothetical protein HWE27_10710 [Gammaproteobacteria bacterium]|nr:hypothetical protein [Gammaproteobacteria bacterium]
MKVISTDFSTEITGTSVSTSDENAETQVSEKHKKSNIRIFGENLALNTTIFYHTQTPEMRLVFQDFIKDVFEDRIEARLNSQKY